MLILYKQQPASFASADIVNLDVPHEYWFSNLRDAGKLAG